MSFMKQMIGGSIGFVLGGPIGAVLGAVIGGMQGRASGFGQTNQLQVTFFVATFSMLGKMAAADGNVSDEETRMVEAFTKNQMKFDDATRVFAMKVYHQAVIEPASFDDLAKQFYSSFSSQPQMLISMIDMLLQVSMADGVLHEAENRLLNSAVNAFGITQNDYLHLKERYISDTDKHYAVLGCGPNAPMTEVQQKYRQLVKDFHPDTIVAKGLPEEFTHFASTKFQQIQDAYEAIKKAQTA